MIIKDVLANTAVTIALLSSSGTVGVWAASQYFVTHEALKHQEIMQLDREITYIQIKIDQNEATKSEMIYIETLKQQKRALESQ